MIKFKQVKVSEPELITNPDEIRYCNEILPLKAEISELEQETIKLTELWKKSKEENRELKKTIEKIKEHVEEYGNGKFKVVFGIHILRIIGGKNE